MNYRFLLSILFISEMMVGTALVCYGGGMLGHIPNMITIGLGVSVFLVHALEYLLLTKLCVVGEMCNGLGFNLVSGEHPAPTCLKEEYPIHDWIPYDRRDEGRQPMTKIEELRAMLKRCDDGLCTVTEVEMRILHGLLEPMLEAVRKGKKATWYQPHCGDEGAPGARRCETMLLVMGPGEISLVPLGTWTSSTVYREPKSTNLGF